MSKRDIVERARALADKAARGPWIVWEGHAQVFAGPVNENSSGMIRGYRGKVCECDEMDWSHAKNRRNARFIAAARTLVPALCDEVEGLRALSRKLAEGWPAPLGGTFTFDVVTKEWWYGQGTFRRGPFPSKVAAVLAFVEGAIPLDPDNPWPGHPVQPPEDPAEAALRACEAEREEAAAAAIARDREELRQKAAERLIERYYASPGIEVPIFEYLGWTPDQYAVFNAYGVIPAGWEPPADAFEGEQS